MTIHNGASEEPLSSHDQEWVTLFVSPVEDSRDRRFLLCIPLIFPLLVLNFCVLSAAISEALFILSYFFSDPDGPPYLEDPSPPCSVLCALFSYP